MEPMLNHQVSRQIEAAHGYYLLGMFQEALGELQSLPEEVLAQREVMGLRLEIFRSLQQWELMRVAAGELVERDPNCSEGWINLAYATRREISILEAQSILEKAVVLHSKDPTIQFNLGCYHCQQGNLEAARAHLSAAIQLDPIFEKMGAEDSDYAPLWAPE